MVLGHDRILSCALAASVGGLAIWEIVAMNKAHVVLRFHAGNRPIDSESLTQVVPLHEHDFYRADDLAAAFEAPAKQPSATIVRIRDC
jgi:hypothetical protein